MKVRVIRTFRDKHTNEIRRKGQEIEVTKERLDELLSAALGPFVERVEGPKEQKDKTEKQPKTKINKAKK